MNAGFWIMVVLFSLCIVKANDFIGAAGWIVALYQIVANELRKHA